MESTTFLNDLPPHKRLRLIQQQQQQQENSASSPLPAKKRRESRNPPSPVHPSPTIYSLPAKKRVCALHPQNDAVPPFDLNVEYNPSPHEKAQAHSPAQQEENTDDDGILCCVCQSTDGDPSDPIVFCDGCDLMVHASCYGNPLSKGIPEGDWFCERCRFIQREKSKGNTNSNDNNNNVVCCALCPVKEGAMKRTTDARWAHVVCAVLVPEVFFWDPEGRERIDCSKVPKKRWLEKCYVCGCCDGCALVCSEPKCGLAFHATCGLKEELCIEYKVGKNGATIVAGFCKTHSQLWEKQQQSGKYKIVASEDKKCRSGS
ncbi:protein Jade-1 [Abrus precatorius]|uniref:Protein Jade-1 n=1 Tax=Abrus precatorius TaxID=3816 RepID=A0A8B8LKK1_ABRPR|nr:protein Jade-1 [Abrus precatorius]